jgi:bifunctional non-homologous end joining protein LigD
MMAADQLREYRSRRRFEHTPEPRGVRRRQTGWLYTLQMHDARRLHYDLRLQLDGVLKSWAITRGPSLNPADKRLAVQTEDHPLEYATFEGTIPAGSYGAGTVLLWDRGTWEPIGDPHAGLARGKLVFRLHGERLRGRWALVRFRGPSEGKRNNWLLVKEKDEVVDRDDDLLQRHRRSVASGRDLGEIEGGLTDPEKHSASSRKRGPHGPPATPPAFVQPALATLVDRLPSGDDWVYELKLDGYRLLAAVAGDAVRLYTRNRQDWTHRFPGLVQALQSLQLDRALLDGEVVVVTDDGRPSFAALQRSLRSGGAAPSYFAFDLLKVGGENLRQRPLLERKSMLQRLLAAAGGAGPLHFGDHLHDGEAALETLCQRGFEGLIAKRARSIYRSGRTRAWLKLKCVREQEFVIVGWSPSRSTRPFASILLALPDKSGLRYAGRVGTGFDADDFAELAAAFRRLERHPGVVSGPIPVAVAREARWVEPELVAQVAYAELTEDGLLRHGRYRGLRQDKPASQVTAEPALAIAEGLSMSNEEAVSVDGVRLTHPEKVLFPTQGVTKLELAEYLLSAAERMLPQLRGRLLSLVRCPEGRGRSCFFQRHASPGFPKDIHELQVTGKDEEAADYLFVDSVRGLLATAQMGVLELHIWGSRVDRIDAPDRMVFDLDPDEAVDFRRVKEAAAQLREALQALELESFALVTGGKGVHVVVPLQRRNDWDTVRAFSAELAKRFAANDPERFVATMSKSKRKGRIFIDYFRNGRGATAIAPYSPRAREGAPVAWPVSWERLAELADARPVTLENVDDELRQPDPWAGYAKLRQSLKKHSIRALGLDA